MLFHAAIGLCQIDIVRSSYYISSDDVGECRVSSRQVVSCRLSSCPCRTYVSFRCDDGQSRCPLVLCSMFLINYRTNCSKTISLFSYTWTSFYVRSPSSFSPCRGFAFASFSLPWFDGQCSSKVLHVGPYEIPTA